MKRLIATLIAFLFCGFLPYILAADVLLIVNKKQEAYTLDTVTGEKQFIQADAVYIDKGVGNGGNTPDGDTPEPPDDASDLRKKVREWVADVDDTPSARLFALMFEGIVKGVKSGQIGSDASDIDKAITEGVKYTLDYLPRGSDKDDWKDVKKNIQREVSRIAISKGGDLSEKEWLTILEDVQHGFEDSYAGEAIPPWLAPILAEFARKFFDWLLGLF